MSDTLLVKFRLAVAVATVVTPNPPPVRTTRGGVVYPVPGVFKWIALTVPPATLAPIVAVAEAGATAVPVPEATVTVGVVVYPAPPEAKTSGDAKRAPATAVTVRLPQPVRFVSDVGLEV
jgi:hypothetical protein